MSARGPASGAQGTGAAGSRQMCRGTCIGQRSKTQIPSRQSCTPHNHLHAPPAVPPTLDVLRKPLLQRLGKLQALVVAPHVVVDHLHARAGVAYGGSPPAGQKDSPESAAAQLHRPAASSLQHSCALHSTMPQQLLLTAHSCSSGRPSLMCRRCAAWKSRIVWTADCVLQTRGGWRRACSCHRHTLEGPAVCTVS